MPSVNPRCFHQSASSIAAFKSCPQRWRLAYREGLRADKDTDSQRNGTNWHSMHEVFANALGANPDAADPSDLALHAVIGHLNSVYEKCPSYKTVYEWELEREILLTCFIGYQWYWSEDIIEFLYSELAFDLPLHAPRTGLPLSTEEVIRVGKIDHVISWQNSIGALERKSTTRSIAPDSDFWDTAKKDTQVSMYALAFRDMATNDAIPEKIKLHACFTQRFGGTLYDVWHRPTIKPAMLTQKETAEFIETGKYCDQEFKVIPWHGKDSEATKMVTVDDVNCEIEIGKKGFAIKETIKMFCARLLGDIYIRPDFYFARREIPRTDAELQKFRIDLYNIYQTQRTMDKTGHFYENESQCRATFPCTYIPICYGPGADAVCDGKTTPNGFKRIFVDLTVEGQSVSEE